MADETVVEKEEKDPIVESSLSWPISIAALLLVLSTGWAAYDEFVARRPWKKYQAAFVPAYERHLEKARELQIAKEKEIEQSDEYRELKDAWEGVHREAEPEHDRLTGQLARITEQMTAVTQELKEARSYTAAVIYKIEKASSQSNKEALQAHLAEYHQGPFTVYMPDGNSADASQEFSYLELLDRFNQIRDERSELRAKLGELAQQEAAKKKDMDAYKKQHLDGPPSSSMHKQIAFLNDNFKYDITSHQIHVKEVGLVERCEVCHLAIRSPVAVTAEDIQEASSGAISETMAKAFTSHPRVDLPGGDLLKVHRPDKFACTPCHGGNGRALSSEFGGSAVDHAHGRYKHWLWPMYELENTEAGCVQCHEGALHLEGATTLNRGRYLFQRMGCWGCHSREGYDAEAVALKNIAQEERNVENRRRALEKQRDDAEDDGHFDLADAIKQKLSQTDSDADQIAPRKRSLQRARKKSGPSLKGIRAKLKKDWLPVWLENPRAFRLSTRMPQFDLTDDRVKAISAFLWQAAAGKPQKELSQYDPGDPQRGKTAFETRGCRACHNLDGAASFASNLARLDEKANYDYLVDWIQNPPEGAIMPDLRLAEQEARDVASYLQEQKTGTAYKPAEHLTDEFLATGEGKSLIQDGKALVEHYGCFGCHDIVGTENLSKIATDLTEEGSKPLERLDFALLTHGAERGGWYTHKGFFDRKLADPQQFDEGKLKLDWHEQLKMPDFGLKDKPEDRRALVTFLLGSVDSQLPEFFHHNPTGWDKDIEVGWWVAKKYHCTGCHQIVPGQTPEIWKLSQYDGEGRAKAPPSLAGAGARLDPHWLAEFLRNPALSKDPAKQDRNGARMYLDIRMPTYKVAEEEIGKLVRFLNALSKQPSPYPFEELEPLNEDELVDARTLFQVGKCLSCHVTSDDPKTFTSETKAPSYIVGAERLKPRWMRHWLRDPDQIMPGTVMPSFFQEVDGRWRATVMTDDKIRVKGADHVELMVRYQKFFDEAEAEYWQRLEQAGE